MKINKFLLLKIFKEIHLNINIVITLSGKELLISFIWVGPLDLCSYEF